MGRLTPPLPFRPLSRRSGRIPALPYPPLRCFQSGSTPTSPTTLLHRTAITPLTSCLTPRVHFTAAPAPLEQHNQISVRLRAYPVPRGDPERNLPAEHCCRPAA